MVETKGQKKVAAIEFVSENPANVPSNAQFMDSTDTDRLKFKDSNDVVRDFTGMPTYDIRDYGLETNFATAMNAALAAAKANGGGIIYIPPGTYDCDDAPVQLGSFSNILIYAYGAIFDFKNTDVGHFLFAAGTQKVIPTSSDHVAGARTFTVSDATSIVAGDYCNGSRGAFLRIIDVTGTTITVEEPLPMTYGLQNINVYSSSQVINNMHWRGGTFKNWYSTASSGAAFYAYCTVNSSFKDMEFIDCEAYVLIYFNYVNTTIYENIRVKDFVSRATGSKGTLTSSGGASCTYKNCRMTNSSLGTGGTTSNGIMLSCLTSCTIENNFTQGCTIGIMGWVSSSQLGFGWGNSILNNKIEGAASHGIYLKDSDVAGSGRHNIIGNTCINCTTDGIYYYGVRYSIIEHNNCVDGISSIGVNTGTIVANNIVI